MSIDSLEENHPYASRRRIRLGRCGLDEPFPRVEDGQRPLVSSRVRPACRQDRNRACAQPCLRDRAHSACNATKGSTSTTLSTNGTTRASCYSLQAGQKEDLGTIYSDEYLLKRPLLQAIDPKRKSAAVLLIDEIDRARRGRSKAFLLELLSDFQVTIPRARQGQSDPSADRDPHLEPDARDTRRPQTPVHLLLDRLPELGQRARDRFHEGPGSFRVRARPSRHVRSETTAGGSAQAARHCGDPRLGRGPWLHLGIAELDTETVRQGPWAWCSRIRKTFRSSTGSSTMKTWAAQAG